MNVNEHFFSPDPRWKQWHFFCLWTTFTPTGLFQPSACPTRVRLTPPWWRIHQANYPPPPMRTAEPEHDYWRRWNWIDGQMACCTGIETESIEPSNLSQHWSMRFLGQTPPGWFLLHLTWTWWLRLQIWFPPTIRMRQPNALLHDAPWRVAVLGSHIQTLTRPHRPAGDWAWWQWSVGWSPVERIKSGISKFSHAIATLNVWLEILRNNVWLFDSLCLVISFSIIAITMHTFSG